MSAFVADLSAAQTDAALRASLRELRAAEQNSVLYFAKVMNRRLYRELGYATMQQYAVERLQFSRSKTGYFVQLAAALKRLPKTRALVARGDLPWTKAVEVVKVATSRTEMRWLAVAQSSGRRDLADKVRRARRQAERGSGEPTLFTARGIPGAQDTGLPVGNATTTLESASAPAGSDDPSRRDAAAPTAPNGTAGTIGWVPSPAAAAAWEPADTEILPPAATDVRLRLSSEQRARYEAMLEKLRKVGDRGDRAELVLEALTLLVLQRTEAGRRGQTRGAGSPASDLRVSGSEQSSGRATPESSSRLDAGNPNSGTPMDDCAPPVHSPRSVAPVYQVYVRVCEQCDRGWMETTSGPELLDVSTLRAILCDARVSRPGEPNRHTIPSGLRRRALERDRYRCRALGCRSHRFLDVHHIHATGDGGPHRIDNLITLCRACHTMVHKHRASEATLVRPVAGPRGRVAVQQVAAAAKVTAG